MFSAGDWVCEATLPMGTPLLSVALSDDGKSIAAGSASGQLLVRRRKEEVSCKGGVAHRIHRICLRFTMTIF